MSNHSQFYSQGCQYFMNYPNIYYFNPLGIQDNYSQPYLVPYVNSSQIFFTYQNPLFQEFQIQEQQNLEIGKGKTQFVTQYSPQLTGKKQKIEKIDIVKNQDQKPQIKKTRKHQTSLQLQRMKINQKDRNILSNSLKLAIKNIRNILKQNQNFYKEINEKLSLNYPLEQFQTKFNYYFSEQQNYIRPSSIKTIILQQTKQFSLIFKILIKKFYREFIYLPQKKLTKMKRLIRIQHIKAGRELLDYFFMQKYQNQQ